MCATLSRRERVGREAPQGEGYPIEINDETNFKP